MFRLPGHSNRAAIGMRHLPLRAQRALKEGVVIRKRQGEPWFPLLLCAVRPRRPHSRQLRAGYTFALLGEPPCAAQAQIPPTWEVDTHRGAPCAPLRCRRRRIIRAAYNIINRSIVKIG